MKQTTSYRFLTIQGKLKGDLKIIIDTERNPEYTSTGASGNNISLTFYPLVNLTIVRPSTTDENGQRIQAPWNVNDSLSMNKFNVAIFRKELTEIIKSMEITELYTYHGTRLELNEEMAEKVRRVFMIGMTTVEISPVVIVQDDSRLEGVKMKFNNEQSSVLLTLNDLTALQDNINRFDIDSIAMLLYLNYIKRPDHPKNFSALNPPTVDIVPKNHDFT